MKKFIRLFAILYASSTIMFITGCAGYKHYLNKAERAAEKAGFKTSVVKTSFFKIKTFYRIDEYGQPLTVYIEGDGRAWVSKKQLSNNPTPHNPLVTDLAMMDPSVNILYIARPCQYISPDTEPMYNPSYWAEKRFSEVVIRSIDEVISKFKKTSGSEEIHLIGYSGGGAVAVLVAARRQDISTLRTIAGNLDHIAINNYHKTTPLTGSLNPIDYTQCIEHIPQQHFIGGKDTVVPPFAAQNFTGRMKNKCFTQIIEVKGCSHNKGWRKYWEELLFTPSKSKN